MSAPNPGFELQVWWVPQVPGPLFTVDVRTVEVGAAMCEALADYDLFQFENRIKPDYANMGGLQVRHPVHTRGEWHSYDVDDADALDELRALLAEGASL